MKEVGQEECQQCGLVLGSETQESVNDGSVNQWSSRVHTPRFMPGAVPSPRDVAVGETDMALSLSFAESLEAYLAGPKWAHRMLLNTNQLW